MKLSYKLLTITGAIAMTLSLAGCGSSSAKQKSVQVGNRTTVQLAKQNYKPGTKAFENINHDKSTLNPRIWKHDHVDYTKLDHEQRTSAGNTGTLDKQNVANDSLRVRQTVKPTGYVQRFVNGKPIVNRGHEIAYSLSKGIDAKGQYNPKLKSGDQNNKKNLFTQTAFSNQELQTIYESKVRNALKHGEKVVYQVTPVFKGGNKMAKGVHMQAISTNRKLNFNVYLFNVQPGIKFDYKNGKSSNDRAMKVPTPKNAPHFNDNQRNNQRGRRFGRRGFGFRRYRHGFRGYRRYRRYPRRRFYPRYLRNRMRRRLFRNQYRHFHRHHLGYHAYKSNNRY